MPESRGSLMMCLINSWGFQKIQLVPLSNETLALIVRDLEHLETNQKVRGEA
jgi:hypothetical protein